MAKVRYKVTKEQVEKLVENFVMEAAAPEAKKHVQGSVEAETYGHSVKTGDGRNGKSQAPEAKKHVKGSTGGSKQVEERPNTPNASEVDPGTKEDEQSHAPEAKKHVKGSVSENSKKKAVLTEGVIDKVKNYFQTKFMELVDSNPEVAAAFEKVQDEASKLSSSDKEALQNMDPTALQEAFIIKDNKILVESKFLDKVQTYLGLGVSGSAFASAVAVLIKAAVGAGMYTFGLPVGVIVAIAMGVFAVSGYIGHAGYDKLKSAEEPQKPTKRPTPSRKYDSRGRRR
jgi:hypothetical protein